MGVWTALCHLKDRLVSSAHLQTKSLGGCKALLQGGLLQILMACVKAGKSVSCCDNGNKTVAIEPQGCTHSKPNKEQIQ